MIKEVIDAFKPALEKVNINETKILSETLRGHFTHLNEKESIVCAGICYSIRDYDFSDEEMVIYYCLQVQNNKVFSDEDDVKRTINELRGKKIIIYKTWFSKSRGYENFIRPHTSLHLSGYLEEEIVYYWRKEFEYAFKGTFCVHKGLNPAN